MHITSVQVEDYFKHVNQKDDDKGSTKKSIRECINAINEVQLWDWLKNASGEELLFSPESKIIFDKNVERGNDGRSGAS